MSWFGKMFGGKKEPATPTPTEADAEAKPLEEADEVLPEDNRSLILQLISANGISAGMDLSKVTLPTFILEPRSLLEKLSDTVIHPEIFANLDKGATPEERMLGLARWYFSAYHVRPKGTKKPFNPVWGETYKATLRDHAATADTEVTWAAQQVSHHPPISAFFARTKAGNVAMQGCFAPKSKFLGNSAASIGNGGFRVYLVSKDEQYYLSWPTAYVRGILFGTLLMEIGGPVTIQCVKTDLRCDIDFVVKPFFGGGYHSVKGTVRRDHTRKDGEVVYNIEGKWTEKVTWSSPDGTSGVLFHKAAEPAGAQTHVDPFDESAEAVKAPTQRMWSSRHVWAATAAAVAKADQAVATKAKTEVEEFQRKLRADRAAAEEEFTPNLFKQGPNCEWMYLGADAVPFPAVELE